VLEGDVIEQRHQPIEPGKVSCRTRCSARPTAAAEPDTSVVSEPRAATARPIRRASNVKPPGRGIDQCLALRLRKARRQLQSSTASRPSWVATRLPAEGPRGSAPLAAAPERARQQPGDHRFGQAARAVRRQPLIGNVVPRIRSMAVIRTVHTATAGHLDPRVAAYTCAAAAMLACSTCSRTSLASQLRMLSSVSGSRAPAAPAAGRAAAGSPLLDQTSSSRADAAPRLASGL